MKPCYSQPRVLIGAGAVVLAVACGKTSNANGNSMASSASTPATASDTGMKSGSTMGGMTGMKQMSPAESALVDSVQSHLSAQSTMTAAQLASSMSAHRALVKSLLVQMDSDRKAMTAPPDSAWIATEDSVKADLNKLATLPRAQLKAAVASDSARISRLIEMRKSMMGKPAP